MLHQPFAILRTSGETGLDEPSLPNPSLCLADTRATDHMAQALETLFLWEQRLTRKQFTLITATDAYEPPMPGTYREGKRITRSENRDAHSEATIGNRF